MAWMKWLPWRFIVRRVANAHGFLDPMALIARLRRFAEPSEVAEPIELLRAGMVFHARGLINNRVIQNNLDWVWPYWVERQFDPEDDAFIPRGFSMSDCNFSHRNWTAIGWPDCAALPIVDPRGLLTPLHDGWSLDTWVLSQDGRQLLPSRTPVASQRLELDDGIAVVTESRCNGATLHNRAHVYRDGQTPICRLEVGASNEQKGWLVVALRPCNPEGVSFVQQVVLDDARRQWTINGKDIVRFDRPVPRHHVSNYRAGDVNVHLQDENDQVLGECDVGMTTAAALFELEPKTPLHIAVEVPLNDHHPAPNAEPATWARSLTGLCQVAVPDAQFQFLYEAALRTLILHSTEDIYPGPYTYRRFWFRDAAFIIQALLYAGLTARAERALQRFPDRQRHDGYFHSQDGEWDSNGEALWIMHRYVELTGAPVKAEWRRAIQRGAHWIDHKRLRNGPNAGLLPAGFSAEHLGPNNCYYWDDFWGIAGLRGAAALCRRDGNAALGQQFEHRAEDFMHSVTQSLARAAGRVGRAAMPAAPNRRLDAGVIGSLAAGYPLQLFAANDPRLLDSLEFLLEHCMVGGGFFQDIVHSGINPYLTLQMAQVLMRAGDPRHADLTATVAALASPTGQWPEAIHPRTGGGCMGDGQHVWAAAEWVAMLRNMFMREEGERLILASGLPREWLTGDCARAPIRFGPCPTSFGLVSVEITTPRSPGQGPRVSWSARWHGEAPPIVIQLPGFAPVTADANTGFIEMEQTVRHEI